MNLPKHIDAESSVLLHSCFFARRDEFGVARVVGQAGSLRPIVNRPNVANVQYSSFAACRYAGQVVETCGGLPIRLPQDATRIWRSAGFSLN